MKTKQRDKIGKKAVIILGMHRSGSSLLAGICHLLGADLGSDLIPPAKDNPKGFWENQLVVDFHDQLLSKLQRRWDAVLPLRDQWWMMSEFSEESDFLESLLKAQFSNSELWAVKDPRICLLLPFWLDILERNDISVHFILIHRHPNEIVQSLINRNDMAQSKSQLLYLHHYLDAELNTRQKSRTILSYDQLLEDWQQSINLVSSSGIVEWPNDIATAQKDIEKFVDRGIRHNEKNELAVNDELGESTLAVYEALKKIGEGELDFATKDLDLIREKITGSEKFLLSWMDELEKQSLEIKYKQAENLKSLEVRREQQAEIEVLEKLKAEYIQKLEENNRFIIQTGKDYQKQIRQISLHSEEQQNEIKEITDNNEKQQIEIEALGNELADHQKESVFLQQSLLEEKLEADKLSKIRVKLIKEISDLVEHVSTQDEDIGALNLSLEQKRTELETLQVLYHEKETEIHRLTAVTIEQNQVAEIVKNDLNLANQNLSLQYAEILRIRASLESVYSSTSWKLTVPLRKLKGLWNVVGATSSLLSLALRSKSLVHTLLIRIPRVMRKRGLRGLIKNFPEYVNYALRINQLDQSVGTKIKEKSHEERYHPEQEEGLESIDATISVVIPTYNAGHEFYWLLRKLSGQKGLSGVEIVIVDSGSSDDTASVASSLNCKVVNITQEEFSHSYSRNLGAKNATGDYLIFMVQDAYPIGDYWLYGILRYLLDHKEDGVAAVSCAEYCRLDSDITYDCNVDTHYKFLMCREADRIGSYIGDDHMSLRSQGQLSDVSCLIPRALFLEYGYQGDYAEDLDLGIRLIKNDKKVAMLASIKTIHSHNRPAYYYFKRSFVDVIFLVRQFEDSEIPQIQSFQGLMLGIVSSACNVSRLINGFEVEWSDEKTGDALQIAENNLINASKNLDIERDIELQDEQLSKQLSQYRDDLFGEGIIHSTVDEQEAYAFFDGFIGRIRHFRSFAKNIYLEQDSSLREELLGMYTKNFASTVGAYLGFMYLRKEQLDKASQDYLEKIREDLQAGI
ncbi:MAG: glycosyltransferase [Pseudomonadales bacterium]|nr:glycosyltransferase [Pseudomonadales bacterium]